MSDPNRHRQSGGIGRHYSWRLRPCSAAKRSADQQATVASRMSSIGRPNARPVLTIVSSSGSARLSAALLASRRLPRAMDHRVAGQLPEAHLGVGRSQPAVIQKLIQRVRSCRESADESLFITLLRLEQQIREDLKNKCRTQIKRQGFLKPLDRRSLIIP